MKVLVIPDIHLKPWMFERASELLKENAAKRAVCLMDLADDWNQQLNLSLYMQTFEAAIHFSELHPETLWCYGNHDVCYLWNQRESGFSGFALPSVNEGLRKLKNSLPDAKQMAFIHRIDDVIFLHGGLTAEFVRLSVEEKDYHKIDMVLGVINGFGPLMMWEEDSPIWFRPQYCGRSIYETMYKPKKLLQVVGHTPMWKITRADNLISCDVFSTDRDGKPFGTQEFLVIDTKTWEWYGVK